MGLKFGLTLLLICTGFVVLLIIMLEKRLEKGEDVRISAHPDVTLHVSESMMGAKNLLDLKDFRHVIDPDCNTTFLVWIVTSYAGDARARSALRRAYTNDELKEFGIRRVFLLGLLDEEAQHKTYISQNALIHEAKRFNDILQGNFFEAYRNLTYKHLMGLRWAVEKCRYSQYVMKSDDDIVVNLYEIINRLKGNTINNNTLMGYIMKNVKVAREPANKWFVTNEEFDQDVYPDFLSGWLYLSTRPTIAKLVSQSKFHRKPFWIDDVYLTGCLREECGIKMQSINELFTTDFRFLECCIEGKKKELQCEIVVGPNGGDAELQVKFRDFAEFCRSKCSKRPPHLFVSKTCVTKYDVDGVNSLTKTNGTAQIKPIKIL